MACPRSCACAMHGSGARSAAARIGPIKRSACSLLVLPMLRPMASGSAALAGVGEVGRLYDRAARVVLAFADIAVGAPVVVGVGPHRAGKTADRGADHRAFEHAKPADQRTG